MPEVQPAFQEDAFQYDAFQIGEIKPPTPPPKLWYPGQEWQRFDRANAPKRPMI